ncbi:MAG: PD40 domain-containing protein [Anaerolineae bacterium]|nr:PD40 domain-containing protein [Anaerolineae bacterium]
MTGSWGQRGTRALILGGLLLWLLLLLLTGAARLIGPLLPDAGALTVLLSLDSSAVHLLDGRGGPPVRVLRPYLGDLLLAAWSPDGSRLLAQLLNGSQFALLVHETGSGVTYQITTLPACATGISFGYAPVWSPDGTQVVFSAQLEGDNCDLFLWDALHGDTRRLTSLPGNSTSPTWSPDGTRLAFVSSQDGNQALYTLDVASGTAEPLADLWSLGPAWSPDGNRIALTASLAAQNVIVVVDAATGVWQNLSASQDGQAVHAQWSPDGTWLVYDLYRPGRGTDLYLADLTSGDVINISPPGDADGEEKGPLWSPDGRWLVYESWDGGTRTMILVDVANESLQPLFSDWTRASGNGGYDWQGTRLTYGFTEVDGTCSIYIYDAATGETRHLTTQPDPLYMMGWWPQP